MWNNRACRFDEYYKTFRGAIEHYVDWEILKHFLPKNKKVNILDAAGGTGRISLPLAKMGYSITLCDISPKMLEVAELKMQREDVIDKVKICRCDIRNLDFKDELFDFVISWNGNIDDARGLAAKELIRVTKKGGIISIFLVNKWAAVIDNFNKNPDDILSSIDSVPSYLEDPEGKYIVLSPEEAKNWFEAEGIEVINIYGVCGWTDVLHIPKKILESHTWDEKFFKQTIKMILKLSNEPSIKGLTRHLVLYGKKL